MNKPTPPRPTLSTITAQSKIGKFRIGDTFKPWNIDNVGTVTSVTDKTVRYYYADAREAFHEASPSELRRIIGIKK